MAAPTTSLPELIGGVRNWDYRFCWVRDATLTLQSLIQAGYLDEARDWREWLLRAVAGSPSELNILYGLRGERRLTELELPWLQGYENPLRFEPAMPLISSISWIFLARSPIRFFRRAKPDLDPTGTRATK